MWIKTLESTGGKKSTSVNLTLAKNDAHDFTLLFLPSGVPAHCSDSLGAGGSCKGRSSLLTGDRSASWRKANAACNCLGPDLHPAVHWVGLYPLWPPHHAALRAGTWRGLLASVLHGTWPSSSLDSLGVLVDLRFNWHYISPYQVQNLWNKRKGMI